MSYVVGPGQPVIAWIDVETTGLDTRDGHQLLQLAAIVTDKRFDELATIETKFYFDKADVELLRDSSVPYVRDMHDKTELWSQLSSPVNPSHEDFDKTFSAWLREFGPAGTLLFGGNSITLDREFMREYLPLSYDVLSYQNVDMSSVENFFMFIEDRPKFSKKTMHEALEDIRESIAQAVYHRNQTIPF